MESKEELERLRATLDQQLLQLKSFVSKLFELIILAAARAELVFEKASSEIETFRIEWGRVLTKFLT